MKYLLYTLLFLYGCTISSTHAQNSPYHLSFKRELPILAGGVGLSITGRWAEHKIQPLTEAEIQQLDAEKIPAFDRSATKNWSPTAQKASDALMIGSIAAPFALAVADRPIRKEIWKAGVIGVEVFLLNYGITQLTKSITKRPRPFVYNDQVPLEEKFSRDARMSYFSGHTSVSAAMSFYTAKLYHDYHPNDRSRPYVWGAAALLPAITGYLRYKGGKHYLSDILTGYAVGACTGILIPQLHKKTPRAVSETTLDKPAFLGTMATLSLGGMVFPLKKHPNAQSYIGFSSANSANALTYQLTF